MPAVLVAALAVAVAVTAASCFEPRPPLIVASSTDTEGVLLSKMMVMLLRNADLDVIDKSSLGSADEVRQALLDRTITMYPEYVGRGGLFFDEPDSDVWKDPQEGFARIRELDEASHDLIWLAAAPANNTLAIAMPRDLASDEAIETLEDFAQYVSRGATVKLAGSEKLLSDSDGLASFEKTYGFKLRVDQILRVQGDTVRPQDAAAEGTDGANAALVFATDGSLFALDLVVLEDPLHAQLALTPAPLVLGSVMAEHPNIVDILGPVFSSLNLRTLQRLNAEVDVEGRDPFEVAEEYLASNGFFDESPKPPER